MKPIAFSPSIGAVCVGVQPLFPGAGKQVNLPVAITGVE